MNEEITILPIDPTTFEVYDYKTTDSQLIAKSELDTVFSSSTDYIEFYVYDENQTKIYPIDSTIPLTSYSVKEGDILLNPQSDLENLGFDLGKYSITYEFYRKRLASYVGETYFIKEISSDRTEIRLDSNIINNSSIISSANEFIQYRDNAEYFVDFYLNFGNNLNIIANNIVLDDENPEDPTILIKLYEPLPENLGLKDQLWVVEMLSKPQAYQVDFPFIPIVEDDFTYIAGPNFNLNVKQESGNSSQTFSYDTLINSNVTSSVNQIKSLLNEKEIDINVNYEDFSNFVHFSTALTRLENFYYKVGLIESYNNDISTLGNISGDTTDTLAYSSSLASLTSKIDSIIQNFDGYEYFMYFNSGSDYSYPKTNTEPPFTLYSTGSTEVLDWLGSADENSGDYGGVALSASLYDENNQDRLYNTIPSYLKEDSENVKYELFIDMVAQHYDNIWLYTKDITNKFNADNRLEYGISKDLIADAIKDFGIKLYSNNFNNTDLFSAFLGITPSGSLFPFPEMTDSLPAESGYEYVNTRISASNDVIPLNDVNKRLYKRIYHNIPYLLKTKGTIAGLRALITSYGIPDTILRVNEFGGKNRNEAQDWDLKQNVFNYAFDTGVNATNYVSSSFESNSSFGGNVPNTIQFRFKTAGIPSPSSNIPSSDIRYSQSLFSTDDGGNLVLEYTGSGLTTGSYSGSSIDPYDYYGTLKWIPAEQDDPSLSASVYLPLFDKGWWSVQVNMDYLNSSSSLFVANQLDGKLGFNASSSITGFDDSFYNDAAIAYLNKDTNITLDSETYTPFSGSFQELRYFNQEISQSKFYDYVLNPYSVEGNGTNSTPNQLFFRAALGTQLNTGSRTSIHPRVTGSISQITQSFASDSSFYISTSNFIPNVENIYQDQVPSGIKNRVTDKIHSKNVNIAEAPYGFESGSDIPTQTNQDSLSPFQTIQQESFTSSSYTPDVNYLEVAFSPSNQINDDINAQLGYFNLGDYIGDPRQISSSDRSYPSLDTLRDAYFEKYIKGYDVVDFVRLMKFFDNSLFKMIKDFTPARTSLSSGVVIKQHILERNRQRPAQASWSNETYSGSIKPQSRNYSTGSGDVGQYESTDGSSMYKFDGGTGGSFERYNGLQSYPESLNNKFNLTQSYSESIEGSVANQINNEGSFVGYGEKLISDQHEFYDGEFSGSDITVTTQSLNPECAPYLRINDTSIFFNPIFFNSTPGNATFGTVSTTEFLKRNNIPVSGDAWILSEGTGGVGNGKVTYIKLSTFDVSGVSIGRYLDDSNTLKLNLPEGDIEYYIDTVKSYSDYVMLSIKQDIGNFNIISSSNGGSENWSLTASGNYRIGGESGDNDNESQGSFKNNVAVIQNQQFWYYNGDVADAQSFFNIGDQNKSLAVITSSLDNYGSGSYNPQRTSNINWFISCSINYSASVLEGGNEITQSGDLYKGYKYEGVTLTDQNFTLNNESPTDSFIPSPYSTNLPNGGIFNGDYNQQIPGNSGSEAGELGGNVKIGVEGTASFKYLAGTDSALKFNIVQTPQTAPEAITYYSNLSGSGLLGTNGDFEGFKTYGDMVTLRGEPFSETNPTSSTTPTAIISSSRVADLYDEIIGGTLQFYNVLVTYNITGDSGIPVTASVEYSGSNNWSINADIITDENSGIPPASEGGKGPEGATVSSDTGEWGVSQGLVTFDAGYEYIYLRPVLDIKENTDLTYQLNNFEVSVNMFGNNGSGIIDILSFQQGPAETPSTNTISPFILIGGINPKVKAKWELRVTGSSGDSQIYELPSPHPIIELSGSSPISVGFDTVDWGTIPLHSNSVDDMYYLEYTLYGYESGSTIGYFKDDTYFNNIYKGATSTDFEFLSIDNTGEFDTLQISQSVILETDGWDLTGSLRIYKGTEDNPVGDVLLSRQFIVPTDSSTGTFTLTEKLPQTAASQFKYNETYRMGVEVSKSFTSGLDIRAYTMSIFPSSSIYAPLPGPPAYDNYKIPTPSGVFIPTYFGNGVLPFEYALDCQPTLNNYIDSRTNSFIMDVDYTSEGQVTVIKNWYIDAGDNVLYPNNTAESLAKVKVGQYVSTPGLDVFPPKTRVIAIDQGNGEVELSADALSSHDQNLTVFFNDNSLLPVNQNQILEGTAVKATVQDSNYTTIAHTSLRYEGSRASSQYLNIWSPKDSGTYGQTPVVESRDAYFGYFNNISNPYPLLNDKTKVNLNYLIDQEGNALPPSLDDTIAKDIFEKTFPKEGLARIAVSSGSDDLQSLNQLNSIYKIGQYPVPIIYTQNSSRGYASSVPITGSGRISMYDNPDNPNAFTDYSFTAVGTSSLGNGSNGGIEISTILNPTETISSKDYANGWNNGNLPYTSDGIITFNSESFVSAGSNTSQDHYIDLETSIPTTYLYDSDYNRNGSFWRKHKHEEKLELTLKLGLLYSEDGGPTYNNIPFNFEDIGLKVWKSDGTSTDLGSISDKVKYVQKTQRTYRLKRGGFKTYYRYLGVSEIGLNSSNQAEIQIDNDVVVDILKSKGFGKNAKGTQTGGDIAGLEWTLKANSGDNLYLSGSSLQWELSGSILNTNREGENNTFLPDSYPGPKSPVSITLQGSKSHLLAGDNTGSAPFWVFGSELTGGASVDIGTSGSNILFMSSSNINEAYGDSYKQGTLDYTPGASELFPGGEEPTDTSIGDVYSTIKLEVGDEIRFGNNENYSYKIIKVTPPSQNIMGDGVGRLKIELDKSLPYQTPAEGQSLAALNKDFFLVRRYIDNINTLYLDVPFPYGTLPTGSNSPGILYPDFPTKYLQNSASVIVNDLTSKGIIT